jgi:hypothetical protein
MNKTSLVLAFFVAAILVGLFVRYQSTGVQPTREQLHATAALASL